VLVLLAFSIRLPILAEITSSEKAIRDLIATYAAALDRADTSMANQIFSNAPEVTSIHPRGRTRTAADHD
jgi:hypothetical protein